MEVAARLAPNNPMVLAVLAWSLAHTVWYGVDRIADVDVPRAMGLANKAVELGPRIDFVFCNRAHLRLWLKRDHEGCRTDAQRSLISNPGYHTGLLELSLADIFGGRPKAGADCLEVIINQVPADPLRPYFSAMAGLGYLLAGDQDQAREYARDGYERRPSLPIPGLVYAATIALDESVSSSDDFRTMASNLDLKVSDIEHLPLQRQSDVKMLKSRLRKANLPE
jgi:hypothetical protein